MIEKLKEEIRTKKTVVDIEKEEILKQLSELGKDLKFAHDKFEYLSDEDLIDGQIYEIKAIQLRYKFLIHKAKELGIIVKDL